MKTPTASTPSFFARLGLAMKVLFSGEEAARLLAPPPASQAPAAPAPAPKPPEIPQERLHATGLYLLGAFQQEGRLVDFLRQDVAAFSDEEIGAAARVVHAGCAAVLKRHLEIRPVRAESEGAGVALPAGFDARQVRLTGNVAGQGPWKGTLRHHGWIAADLKFPALTPEFDGRVLAPAEVELA